MNGCIHFGGYPYRHLTLFLKFKNIKLILDSQFKIRCIVSVYILSLTPIYKHLVTDEFHRDY